MKQTILGMPLHTCEARLRRRITGCCLLAVLTLGLNLLFTTLRTEENHSWMLLLNILADGLCGSFLVYYVNLHILPQRRFCKLLHRDTVMLEGTVSRIDPHCQRYMDMDCHCVTVDQRRLFLPANTIKLEENTRYTLFLTSNIIVEAEL